MGQGTNQLAITVHLQLQALSKEALNDIKDDLADFFARREGKTLNATSVYIQYSTDHRFDSFYDFAQFLKFYLVTFLTSLNHKKQIIKS